MSERNTVNQIVQIGAESTPGTAVPAGKKLQNINFTLSPKPDVKKFRATGHRWDTVTEMDREWSEWKADGNLDYQDFIYLVSGPFGAATITTPGGGTNSRSWAWTPPVTGAITPKTYSIEQGDAVRAHKTAYGLFTGFSYKGSRSGGFTCDAPMIARAFTDGATMTSSPTAVAMSPVVGGHVNLWIDTTSGALGTTQFTRPFTYEYTYDSGFNVFWPLNRSQASFTGHVDMVPKNSVKFYLEADSTGMGLYPHLQAGDFLYVRFDAQGPIIETTIHYSITHDMAIKLTNVSEFKDTEGIFGIEYEGVIAEDSSWASGQSQVLTVVNQLTAL